jgi:hypothetical protein
MATQELPLMDDPLPRKVKIGAGTAVKVGFFFTFGVLLFTVIISAIIGAVAWILGISVVPQLSQLSQLFGG